MRDPCRQVHARDVVVPRVQILKDVGWKSRGVECLGVALRDERRLGRHLQDHAVPRHDRGYNGIHRRQVRIVPRGEHQHDAERLPADEATEARTIAGIEIRQRFCRDIDHVGGALLESATNLERRVGDRPSHLPRQLRAQLVGPLDHPRHHPSAYGGAFLERRRLPVSLHVAGALERGIDPRL